MYCEVYRIDASTLGELDALRSKNGEYKRQLIQTPTAAPAVRVSAFDCRSHPHREWRLVTAR